MNNFSNESIMNQPPTMSGASHNHQVQSAEPFESRCLKVLQVAKSMFQRNPDWVTFFREVLGVSGAARNVFTTNQEYLAFEQSNEFTQIQQMVASLRSRKIPGAGHDEPTRVITVRLPESLHEALKAEATDHRTSMNKLCISKLLQVLSESEAAKVMARNAAQQSANRHLAPSTQIARNVPPVPRPSNPVPVPAPNRPMYGAAANTPSHMRGPVPSPSNPVPRPSNPNSPTTENRPGNFDNQY